jgi:hypothetical protein
MKTTLLFLSALVLGVNAVLAGSEQIAVQRAKELVNENNVRQGVAPPTQSSSPSGSAATPAPTPASITRLQADLAALKSGSDVSAAQKQKLAQDLIAAAETGSKPSAAAAKNLADGLSSAFAEKPLSPTSRARLVLELDAVLNPSRYPKAKLDGIISDIQAIFQENGAARKDAVAIADNVRTVAGEARR